MPHYDYVCDACQHKEEILQKITEAPLNICPQCQKSSFRRLLGKGAGLQFHGSGFYINDYCTQQSSSANGGEPSSNPNPKSSCDCGKASCS